MSGIIRAPRPPRNYTELRNDTLRDARLSYRARGVLARLLSNEDGYRMTADDLTREGREGRDAIRAALRELLEIGYMQIVKRQDEKGRWVTETFVFDTPQHTSPTTGKPTTGKPASGLPAVGASGALKKNQQNEQKNTTTKPPPRSAVGSGAGAGGGGEKNQNPKRKTPAPPADGGGGDAGEARVSIRAGQEERLDALRETSLADSCKPFQDLLASAASAAGLDRAGTQKLADALAGALAAPDGDPARLKNRNNPARWLAKTAAAIAAGEFIEGAAYLSAVAARQARRAAQRAATGEEDAEHRRRLEAAAAAIQIDPAALAAGQKFFNLSRADRRTEPRA